MTGQGSLTRTPFQRFMVAAHLVWLATVLLLGAWWGRLILRESARIAELEAKLGVATKIAQGNWLKTQNMVYWESATYYALLLVSSAVLFWLYWRDQKRTRALQAFFASLTHELRTPLTSIRLQAESIAETHPGSPLVERLLEDTTRLEAQVERTLELARVEGGGPVFNRSFRLRPVLERIVSSWSEMHRNQVEVDTGALDDLVVEADPVAIQVIFKNLLENSVRHSGREKVRVSLKGEKRPDGVVISYRDNGPGFRGDPRQLGKIFAKGPSSQGAGVGLYLVRVLMDRMGGRASFAGGDGFGVSLRFREGTVSDE